MASSIKQLLHKDEKGLVSIAELLIGIVLLGVLISAGYGLLAFGNKVESEISAKTELQKEAQSVLNTMLDELRAAKAIDDAQDHRIVFVDTLDNRICYYIQDGSDNLMRAPNNSYTGGDVLMSGVSSLDLSYSKADGSSAESAAAIRVVYISFTAYSLDDSQITISLNSRVNMRNSATE